jgi:membrane protein
MSMRVDFRNLRGKLKERGIRIYERADQMSGGVLGILRDTIRQFTAARGSEAAASMAYFAIFSLFPLLLAMIAIGSSFLDESRQLKLEVYQILRVAFPVSADVIIDNIDEILDKRGAVGVLGAIGLLWSASHAFTTLFININRAWSKAAPINFLKTRLLAVGLILLAVILLVVALFSSAVIDLLPAIRLPFLQAEGLFQTPLWILLSSLIPPAVTFLIFLLLFWWIPNTRVRWQEAFWAALLAAISWEATTRFFTWYLSSGIAGYEFIYGTLGTLIALLFWIYLNSLIVIFCAHLSAMIAHHKRKKPEREPLDVNPVDI